MCKSSVLLFLAISAISPFVHANTSPKELVLQALRSDTGSASGFINDSTADMIRSSINVPNTLIFVEITTLKKLKQKGCRRLQVKFTTPTPVIKTKDGKAARLDIAQALNVCENGEPPISEQ